MRNITNETTLADLAVTQPGAVRVFYKHGLDFCCHGNVSLRRTCDRKGIDFEQMVEEIQQEERWTDDTFDRWDEQPLSGLIDHILDRFHATHRQDLPRLIEMAGKVETKHATKKDCPHGLRNCLDALHAELESHMQKEEQVLFPMVQSGRGALAVMPIHVMEQEHENAGATLGKLRDLAHNFIAPEEACATWRALYSGLAEFEEDLMQHIHLENNVLFPRALRQSAD